MFNTLSKCCGAFVALLMLLGSYGTTSAQCADGENVGLLTVTGGSYPGEVSWTMTDALGNEYSGAVGSFEFCGFAEGAYTFTAIDSYGDGWNGATATFTWNGYPSMEAFTIATGGEGTFEGVATVTAIPGCTDDTALNYNPDATEDDGSCIFGSCQSSGSICYDNNGDINEALAFAASPAGETIYMILYGNSETNWDEIYVWDNIDPAAGNLIYTGYGSDAGLLFTSVTGQISVSIESDGLVSCASGTTSLSMSWEAACSFPGCIDQGASNFNPLATTDDGSCEYVYPGCIDATACNYDETANEDDGSCCYGACLTLEMFDSFGDGWSGCQITIADPDGNIVVQTGLPSGGYPNNTFASEFYCIDAGCYVVSTSEDSWPGEVSWNLYNSGELVMSGGSSYGPAPLSIGDPGCVLGGKDAMACNYDAGSNYNDGSCDYSCIGCMDTTAANFDPSATMEGDGSCVYCGSGTYVVNVEMTDAAGDGWNGANYYLTNIASGDVISGNWDNAANYAGDVATDFACIELGCYTFAVAGGAAIGEVGYTVSDQFGTTYLTATGGIESYDIDFGLLGTCAFQGCTDPYCFNYNPSVTIDDGSCVCPPPNNALADAEAIFCGGSFSGNIENASDPDGIVGFAGANPTVTTAGVWYEFNAAADQQILIDLCETSFAGFASPIGDTKLHVFTMDGDGNLQLLVGNDDTCGLLSAVAFTAVTGTDYYIHVSRFSTFSSGLEFVMNVECQDCEAGIPFNDYCENALPQVNGETFTGTTCCASPPLIPSYTNSIFSTNYGVWFTFNSSDYDTFDFNLTNVDGGSLTLTIYLVGGDCVTIADGDFVGCEFTGTCAGSIESFTALVPDTDYYFVVGTTEPADCGTFEFTTTGIYLGCTDSAADNYDPGATQDDGTCVYTATPVNDLCSDAITLECNAGYIEGSTGNASAEGYPDVICNPSPAQAGVWYTFEGTGDFHTVNTCGSVIDSRLHIYASAAGCDAMECIYQNDGSTGIVTESFAGCGFFDQDDAFAEFVSEVGMTYYIMVGFDDAGIGSHQIELTCEPPIYGCMISAACNYDPTANIDSGDCEYTSCACDANPGGVAAVIEMYDSFGDGWSGSNSGSMGGYEIQTVDGTVVAEGTLETAVYQIDEDNYEGPEFGFDVVCLDPGCYNFVFTGADIWSNEQSWVVTDGVDEIISGAPTANSAVSSTPFGLGDAVCGCTDDFACNYDPAADSENGTCEYETCAGCTDETACNYDAEATIEDGTCNYEGLPVTIDMNDSFGNGWQGCQITIADLDGNIVVQTGLPNGGPGNNFASELYCIDAGCYVVTTSDDTFDNEVSWSISGVFGGAISGGSNFGPAYISLGGNNCIVGCTIACACNYDPAANIDDFDSCVFDGCSGCTYEDASNYDENAFSDDGSCTFEIANPCPADLNQDGSVTTTDLLQFLGAFGSVCPN